MRAYVRLLRASYRAIKGVDPHAIVVTGGMPFYGSSDETHFISQLYRQGARGYFDAVGIHPYSATVAQAEERLLTARRLMNRFGDRNKTLWMTEFGWAGGDPDGFITSTRGQAANAAKFLRFAERNRGKLKLGEMFWSAWQDRIFAPGPRNWWGFHLGSLHEPPAQAGTRSPQDGRSAPGRVTLSSLSGTSGDGGESCCRRRRRPTSAPPNSASAKAASAINNQTGRNDALALATGCAGPRHVASILAG